MTELDNPVHVDRIRKDGDAINFYSAPLQFPVLRMSKWQWGELAAAGVDPNTLDGDDYFCQLMVHWKLSDKVNGRGNPYRDIVRVESLSGSDRLLVAVLEELRQIRALLQGAPAPEPQPRQAQPTQPDPAPVMVRGNSGEKRGELIADLGDGLVNVRVNGKVLKVNADRVRPVDVEDVELFPN